MSCSQVERGIVAFWVTLGVPSQVLYCSGLVTRLTKEQVRTWLPIRRSTCLICPLKCQCNADRSLWMLLAHGPVY